MLILYVHFSKTTRATFSFNPDDVSPESGSESEEENMLTGEFEVYLISFLSYLHLSLLQIGQYWLTDSRIIAIDQSGMKPYPH